MRKNQARQACLIAVLLAAFLGALSAYGQKPPAKRGVKDATPAPASTLSAGAYYALIIGIDNYQPPQHKLQTAVNDATALAKLLREQYGFKETKLLTDATRSQILLAINDYKRRLPVDSNVLIYYAGHGSKDPRTQRAYWIPVDAQGDNDVNWISASTITDEISGLQSQHVLIISDSCYSGGLIQRTGLIDPSDRDIYLRRMLESPSRTLMASGRDEPVADGGKDGHSIFAYALLKSLRSIQEDGFTAGDLFYKYVRQEVAGGIGSDQVPQYGIIQNSGHEFGDFVFSRSGKPVVVSAVTGNRSPDPGTPGTTSTLQPTVSLEADRYAVNQVVNAYVDSYGRVDAAGLWQIWPGAPQSTKRAIQNSFGGARSITMKISDRDVEINGTRATVAGQYSQEFTPKNGSLQKSSGPITLDLEKRAENWVITSVK